VKQHRKKNAQQAGSRELVLEAAFETFAQYGYDGTTTRDISEHAGVNVSTLHYHWGDKEQLWLAVCDLYSQRMNEIISESADFTAPPREAIPAFLESIFDTFVAHPELVRINLWITLESEVVDYTETRNRLDPIVELGASYLERYRGRGIPGDVDIESVLVLVSAQLLYTLAQRNAHKHLFGKDLSDPAHAGRIKKSFMKSALHLLGLDDQ